MGALTASDPFRLDELPLDWYIACPSKALTAKPLAQTVFGQPLVLFRDPLGKPAALLDRCAHRNVPLSLGQCTGGALRCGYHGWQYNRQGQCTDIPALLAKAGSEARRVPSYTTCEQDGYVWVYMKAGAAPKHHPFRFSMLSQARYTHVRYQADFEATLPSTLENILDVPHTAYLHKGLFRGQKKNRIKIIVRRHADRAEAEFIGEPRPKGVVGFMLAPKGGELTHVDRFILPSVAQVEYRLGEKSHIVVNNVLTPISGGLTRLHTVVSYRLTLPSLFTRFFVTPLGKAIAKQDQSILKHQSDNIRRFGEEQFTSTEADLLSPHIHKLLKQAKSGADAPEKPYEHETELEI